MGKKNLASNEDKRSARSIDQSGRTGAENDAHGLIGKSDLENEDLDARRLDVVSAFLSDLGARISAQVDAGVKLSWWMRPFAEMIRRELEMTRAEFSAARDQFDAMVASHLARTLEASMPAESGTFAADPEATIENLRREVIVARDDQLKLAERMHAARAEIEELKTLIADPRSASDENLAQSHASGAALA